MPKGVNIIKRDEIFSLIEQERRRQDEIHPKPIVKSTESPEIKAVAHYLWLTEMLSVLIEEVGEVGKALQGEGNLAEELTQVSAVCVRWLENM